MRRTQAGVGTLAVVGGDVVDYGLGRPCGLVVRRWLIRRPPDDEEAE